MRPVLQAIEAQLEQYVTFASPDYRIAVALWIVGTYLWSQCFDSYPYMVITSDTKRSGKTRLSEIMSFMAHKPRRIAGATGPVLLRHMAQGETLFIDEAETMAAEAQTLLTAILNVGYRKGQTITRVNKAIEAGYEEWPAYGPKVFVLIGDVRDTLRDRSIIVQMKRRDPMEETRRFVNTEAVTEGQDIRAMLEDTLTGPDGAMAILKAYETANGLPFLSDRDEEIWLPLFAICSVLAPERMEELKRIAIDVATEKTAPARDVKGTQGAEDDATADEYRRRLLADMCAVIPREGYMHTESLLTALKAIPTAPWRKFRGVGLTANDIGNMMQPLGVRPRPIRSKGGRKGSTVARGYRGPEVHSAAQANNIHPERSRHQRLAGVARKIETP